jgi:hypothetical protein
VSRCAGRGRASRTGDMDIPWDGGVGHGGSLNSDPQGKRQDPRWLEKESMG